MPKLVVIKSPNGAATGMSFELNPTLPNVTIGRIDECEIVIPDSSVSRKHAALSVARGVFHIQDLNSRNKTFVNNAEIEPNKPIALKADDKIRICDFLFRFEDERAARPKVAVALPSDFKKGAPALDDLGEDGAGSTIQASVNRVPAQQLLEAQPSERLRALLDITAALGKSQTTGDLLPRVADVLFGLFRQADRCFIITSEDGGKTLVPREVKTRRPGTGDGGERFSKTIVRNCLEKLTAYLTEDAGGDQNMPASASIAEFRIRSVMCVPIVTPENKALGVIQLDSQDRSKKFTQDDLNFLSAVSLQVAVALENVSLHETALKSYAAQEEVRLAQQVQLGFLPQSTPAVEGYEFFHFYLAAKTVGGDYYDFVPTADGGMAVLLGDVSGKGVPAALLMAKLSAEARFAVLSRPGPAAAITSLNQQLMQSNLNDRYVTFAAAFLNPNTHDVTMVLAGHEEPLIYRGNTGELEKIVPEADAGFPLGWIPDFEYSSFTFRMETGDTVILFTDGVIDAENRQGVKFERDGIDTCLVGSDVLGSVGRLSPKDIGDRLTGAVKAHSAGHPQFDDIAVVCFGRVGPGDDSRPHVAAGAAPA